MSDNDWMECRYCGKKVTGAGCAFSPDGYHTAIGDNDHCIRCGSTSYGSTCQFAESDNVDKVHIHGHGKSETDGKVHCIYCGMVISGTGGGAGCPFSPTGYHRG